MIYTTKPNAQQEFLTRSLHKAHSAVFKLQQRGFCVERVELGSGQPQITIASCPLVVLLGEARVHNQILNGVRFEQHRVEFEHCQVTWIH